MVTHTLKILQYLLQDLQSMPDHRKKLCIKGITGIKKKTAPFLKIIKFGTKCCTKFSTQLKGKSNNANT